MAQLHGSGSGSAVVKAQVKVAGIRGLTNLANLFPVWLTRMGKVGGKLVLVASRRHYG